MRAKSLTAVMGMVSMLIAGCAASPAPRNEAPAAKVQVTGTRIPQAVDPDSRLPATTSPVYVLTREDIDRSGEVEAGEVLRRLPFFHRGGGDPGR